MTDKMPLPSFDTWVRSAAITLRHRGPFTHLQESAPHSLQKAIDLLTTAEMLYPAEDDGFPGYLYFEKEKLGDFDYYFERLMLGLYEIYYQDLATSLAGGELDGKGFRKFVVSSKYIDDSDPGEDREVFVQVNGVLIGEQKDSLLFSEPGVRLQDYSAENFEDLYRLYELVGSARNRPQT